jgi:inorganic pyrophosphatase
MSAGWAIGFSIVSFGVLSLILVIVSFRTAFFKHGISIERYGDLTMAIAGFALGASVVSLFGRVGGGIFNKAADVGVELSSAKYSSDPLKNPGVIADYVGDNVGDVVGGASDMLASFAESVCATMVLAIASPELLESKTAFYLPILIFVGGIIVSLLTVQIASMVTHGDSEDKVERILKNQPFVCVVLMTPLLLALCFFCLPPQMQFLGESFVTTRSQVFACGLFGLWGGYFIGLSSEFFTSHDYYPIQEVAQSCHTGSATDIIYGLALGYMSTIFPVVVIITIIYVSYICAGMYGIGIAACGMFSTIAIILSVTAYCPITDNASGLIKLSKLENASVKADELHAAGKVISAHGRCFSLGGATLVALALFGAFTLRSKVDVVDLLQPIQFSGLIIGAMIPYAFSAQILGSVTNAASALTDEIAKQAQKNTLSFKSCIKECTSASLKGIVCPAIIVAGVPIMAGICFGAEAICGLLAGNIVSGVQIGISFVNSGVAWDNAKKYIEGN